MLDIDDIKVGSRFKCNSGIEPSYIEIINVSYDMVSFKEWYASRPNNCGEETLGKRYLVELLDEGQYEVSS